MISSFYPRSPCGERRWLTEDGGNPLPMVSIHAPRVGSDRGEPCHTLPPPVFLSTLPVWGATQSLRFSAQTK